MKTWTGALIVGALALSACSSGSGTIADPVTDDLEPSSSEADVTAPTTTAPTTALPATTAAPVTTAPTTTAPLVAEREPAEILRDSVVASLSARSFSADVLFDVRLFEQTLTLSADATVDYETIVAEAVFSGTVDGVPTELEVRSDGTSMWLRPDGAEYPALPDGAQWVRGSASRLTGAGTLDPAGLLGAIIALRGAKTVEVIGAEIAIDGVEVTRYATSIPYEDAVAASGDLQADFERAIRLTELPAVLDIEVTIGADDIVRTFDADIGVLDDVAGADEIDLDGLYSISVTGVGEPVLPPIAPNPAVVSEGPAAEAILDQLIG